MIVSVRNKDRDIPLQGTIAYIGQPAFASGYWVGLVLSESLGKNDGSVQNTQYFKCSPKHGLFVRPGQLTILDLGDSMNMTHASNVTSALSTSQSTIQSSKLTIPHTAPLNESILMDGHVIPPIPTVSSKKFQNTLTLISDIKNKLSKSMSILSKQLDMVEEFEHATQHKEGGTVGCGELTDAHCDELFQSMYKLSVEEWKMLKEYVESIKIHKKSFPFASSTATVNGTLPTSTTTGITGVQSK
jgi:hypothetical protein